MNKSKLKQMGFFKLGALAAAMATLNPMANAGVITTSIQATGTYKLGNEPLVNVAQQNFGNTVDVLAFPGDNGYGVANSAGLHSYGSTTGNFGSRSSGYGIYDVTGSFRIEQTITNDTSAAQQAFFNFFITPGQLSNDIGSALSGAEFVTSGLVFDIRKNGNSIWGSAATLSSNSSGTSFTSTGTNLYSGSGTYYTVNGVHQSVDLGVLAAGESISLSYQLDSFANGSSESGDDREVAATSYYVPDQWVESCTGGYGEAYGGDGYGDGYGNVGNTQSVCTPVLIPGHTVEVPGYTVPGRASGSTAQSGDPFDIDFFVSDGGRGDVFFYNIGNSMQPDNDVPEPGSLALFLSALGIGAWTTKRRRAAKSST